MPTPAPVIVLRAAFWGNWKKVGRKWALKAAGKRAVSLGCKERIEFTIEFYGAPLAQWIEHRIPNPGVARSSRAGGAKISREILVLLPISRNDVKSFHALTLALLWLFAKPCRFSVLCDSGKQLCFGEE